MKDANVRRSEKPPTVTVLCECVGCKTRREVGPGEVESNDVPYCQKCYMPMIAISVRSKI